MEEDALQTFYNELNQLIGRGEEEKAREFVNSHFDQLPQDVQADVITQLYFNGLREENANAATIAEVQEKVLEELDALDEDVSGAKRT